MAKKTIGQVVTVQRQALATQLDNPAEAYIGVASLSELENRRRHLGGRIEALPGAEQSRALVYVDRNGAPELWVKPVRHGTAGGGHYETDWRRFCKHLYGLDWKASNTSGLNVDHLFPTATAVDQELAFVRVMPLDAEANQSVGREIEAKMARQGRRGRRVEKGSYFTLAKVVGYRGPLVQSKQPNLSGVAQLVDALVAQGLIRDDVALRRVVFASVAHMLFDVCGERAPTTPELESRYPG